MTRTGGKMNRDSFWAKAPRRLLSAVLFVAAALTIGGALRADDPYAYPVPYVAKNEDASSGITFANLPQSGTIKVFTVDGEQVVELTISPGDYLKSWNPVVNSSGQKVASGVYFWTVDGGGATFTGKLVVVR